MAGNQPREADMEFLHAYGHIMTDLPHLAAESTFLFGEYLIGRCLYRKVVAHLHRDLKKGKHEHG
jgi:hypothetical protein